METQVDLTPLRYFRAVAEHGTLTAAARAVRISQPSLTVAIQKLEAELDTTLFYRDRRGATLTDSGRTLLDFTREIFTLVERAEAAIRRTEEDEVGRFVVGCPEALGAYLLPGLMADLIARHPRIEISLWNGPSPDVQRAVLEREVQFGLVVNPLPHPDLVLSPLFEDATDLMIAATEPSVADNDEAKARLLAGPLIVVEHLPQSRELLKQLARIDALPDRRLVCGDLELVKSLALAGVGVAVLPRRVAAYGHPDALVRLHESLPFVPDTIHLVFRADLHRTRASRTLKDALLEHARAIDAPPKSE